MQEILYPSLSINQERNRDDVERNFAPQIVKYRLAGKSRCFVRPLPFPTAYYRSLPQNGSATSINTLFVTYYRFFVRNRALYASLVTRIARNSKLSFFQIVTNYRSIDIGDLIIFRRSIIFLSLKEISLGRSIGKEDAKDEKNTCIW